jgi:hypothetical protein
LVAKMSSFPVRMRVSTVSGKCQTPSLPRNRGNRWVFDAPNFRISAFIGGKHLWKQDNFSTIRRKNSISRALVKTKGQPCSRDVSLWPLTPPDWDVGCPRAPNTSTRPPAHTTGVAGVKNNPV